MRFDDTGLMCYQFMVKIEENHNCHIDFYVSKSQINYSEFNDSDNSFLTKCPADVDLEDD